MIGLQRRADRTTRAAAEADQPLAKLPDPCERNMNGVTRAMIQIGAADEAHEVAVAGLVGGDQHQRKEFRTLPFLVAAVGVLVLVAEGDVDLAADQRLDTFLDRLLRELQRAEEVVGVGDGDRRRGILNGVIDDLRQRQRAFEQRVCRMHAKMHERPGGRLGLRRLCHRLTQNGIAWRPFAAHVRLFSRLNGMSAPLFRNGAARSSKNKGFVTAD